MTDFVPLAAALAAQFEGCAKRTKDGYVPYLDNLAKPPVWTRGFGRCYGISEDSTAITLDEAKEELSAGLREYGLRCLELAPALASKPACWSAVTCWAWNCGTGAFKVSRLRRAINEGRWDDAAQYILKPDTAGGVVLKGLARRRAAEQVLFLSGL